MQRSIRIWILAVLSLAVTTANTQTIRVGEQELDGLLRSYQLMGKVSDQLSFTVRPIHFAPPAEGKERLQSDSFYHWLSEDGSLQPRTRPFVHGKGTFAVLPALYQFKFNSHHPYGWNDEGMIAAKGLQQQLSVGMYARYGPLSIQVQPQLVTAANPDFATTAAYGATTTGSFTKVYGGQSSVRLHAGPVSLGVSTENLWWGPGQYSALLLTNNAPGIPHITLNTTRPIQTPIGAFEFQIIAGKMNEDSTVAGLYENFHLKPATLTQDWRYLNAMVFTYSPSFIPGLSVGMTRAFQLYGNNIEQPGLGVINKYVPVLSAIFKDNAGGSIEDARGRDQQLSVFARMLFPKAHGEFYFEYGWNDHKANSRDFMGDPEHSAAYIVGGKKLFPLAKKDAWIEVNGELTHMAQSPDYVVRNAGNWYEHSQVAQGMTHQRQILGAGSGMGNNTQTLTVSWIKGVKKLGGIVQRIQHDPRALAGGWSTVGLRDYSWNEVGLGFIGRWNFGKLLANMQMIYAGGKNYGWEQDKRAGNLFITGGLSYYF